jgi:hypothetical protein
MFTYLQIVPPTRGQARVYPFGHKERRALGSPPGRKVRALGVEELYGEPEIHEHHAARVIAKHDWRERQGGGEYHMWMC